MCRYNKLLLWTYFFLEFCTGHCKKWSALRLRKCMIIRSEFSCYLSCQKPCRICRLTCIVKSWYMNYFRFTIFFSLLMLIMQHPNYVMFEKNYLFDKITCSSNFLLSNFLLSRFDLNANVGEYMHRVYWCQIITIHNLAFFEHYKLLGHHWAYIWKSCFSFF